MTFVLPVTVLSQDKNTELGNKYFNAEQYKSALTKYQKALRQNRLLHRSDKYEYFFLLFQISESKRLSKDTTCSKDYQNIVYKYSKLNIPDSSRLDTRIILFVAESEMNLREYRVAEGYYKSATENKDTIPDRFKLNYAYCSLKQNRFGQANQLLNEIKNKQKLEPSYSAYLQESERGLAKSITNSVQEKDTLTLTMTFGGCYGSTTHAYDLIKTANEYKVLVYKTKRNQEKGKTEIDFVKTISESEYLVIVNFEKELRNHTQYKDANWSTMWDSFIIKTDKDSFSIEITYEAFGVGDSVEKLLSKK